jgi:uncharacterized protein YecE (DUF72 family)
MMAGMTCARQSLRFGTAGWDHADWAGSVYPAGREVDRLQAVARYVGAIEIESTYRSWPSPGALEAWARWGHWAGLRFTVLAPRTLTMDPTQADAGEVARLRGLLSVLADAGVLAAAVLQLPQSAHWNRQTARGLSELVSRLEPLPCGIEFRHGSWNVDVVRSWLARREVAFCNLDQPQLPGAMPPTCWQTSRLALIRLHGRDRASWFARGPGADRRHAYRYDARDLGEWVERVRSLVAVAHETIVIATNHSGAEAIRTVYKLRALLGEKGLCLPAPLIDSDPELAELGIEARPIDD